MAGQNQETSGVIMNLRCDNRTRTPIGLGKSSPLPPCPRRRAGYRLPVLGLSRSWLVIALAFLIAGTFFECTGLPLLGQSSTSHADEGFTEPYQTVVVASAESGVLQTLSVREGDTVKQGEILGQLDSQVLVASVNAAREKLKAQGKIKGAQASVRRRSHHLQQIRQLFAREHASDKEVKQAQFELDLANASLESAQDEWHALEMNLKQIEAQLERRIIRAPISGTVLELPRQVGEAITGSESQVATLVALNHLRVRYFMTTDRAMRLKRGQRLKVHFPESHQDTTAIVDFVSPVTDSKSGTVRVELLIDNSSRAYRSGLRCHLQTSSLAQENHNHNPNYQR